MPQPSGPDAEIPIAIHYQRFKAVLAVASHFWHTISNGFLHVIRITTQSSLKGTVLTIDGQMIEADLKELGRIRKNVKGVVYFNLRGLDRCEPVCIQFFRGWLAAGAQLQNATPFLEMILKDSPPLGAGSGTKKKPGAGRKKQ